MHARMSSFVGLPPERIDRTLAQFEESHLPSLEGSGGFEGVMVLVDRQGGKAAAITFWESEAAMRESERAGAEAREAAVETARPEPRRDAIVDHYEVLLRK